ncbi:MAG: tetratricopeptide repeat protein, partial [Sphingobacterium sp.]
MIIFEEKNLLKFLFISLILLMCFSCLRKEKEIQNKIDSSYYDNAYRLLDEGRLDSAFLSFSRIKDLYVPFNDSLNIANCLINMSIIQKDRDDYYGAQETGLQALDFLKPNIPKHRIYLSTNYNNLGAATLNLNDLEKAISFYNLAIRYSDDSINTVTYKNNLALCYQKLKKFEKAISIYNEIANVDFVKNTPIEFARVLSNLARTKWLQNPNYNALPELHEALKIRQQGKDLWGQNASLSHLSDFYVATNQKKSLIYAESMYEIASRLKSSANMLQALEKLIKLAPADQIKKYFQEYQHLCDSIQQARAAAKNQFALIRYEVEKNKADNLRLEK